MFRSINDHRQLQVLHDESEFQFKLQCELTLLQCRVVTLTFSFRDFFQ